MPTIYALYDKATASVAIAAAPNSLNLGSTDREITPQEAAQLTVLAMLTPTDAVLLAQQLFDTATPALSVEEIEHIRTMVTPTEAVTA